MQKASPGLKFLWLAVPISSRHDPVRSTGPLVPARRKVVFAWLKSPCKSFPWEHRISDHTCESKAFAQLRTGRGQRHTLLEVVHSQEGGKLAERQISDPVREHFPAQTLLMGGCGAVSRSCLFWKKRGQTGLWATCRFFFFFYWREFTTNMRTGTMAQIHPAFYDRLLSLVILLSV